MKQDISQEQLACAAAELGRIVDEQINGGAIREFNDATSALQEPGADLGEGSAYLDDGEVSFTPQRLVCRLCLGVADLEEDGSVDAPSCGRTRQCEVEWARKYPDQYPEQNGQFGCSAELSCNVRFCMTPQAGSSRPSILRGMCQIDIRGTDWRARMGAAMDDAELSAPGDAPPAFDGIELWPD